MTTPTINLTELRAAIEQFPESMGTHFGREKCVTVLALIDLAEAAIELFDDQPEIQADYPQLHETLDRFTIDHPQ